MDKKTFALIARTVAAEFAAAPLSEAAQNAVRNLEAVPEHLFDLVDLLARESQRKRPNEAIMQGYALLIGHGLEKLRYQVDSANASAIAEVDRLRRHLIAGVKAGRLNATTLLIILNQFTLAKLDMGDDLRAVLFERAEAAAAGGDGSIDGASANPFISIVRDCDADPFAIHSCLAEVLDTVPDENRAVVVTAAFASREPALLEAALGLLLNASEAVRRTCMECLEEAASQGLVTPTMLRRMIAVRSWLLLSERTCLDRVIDAARSSGVDGAPWPRARVKQILCSGVDGAGAFSIIAPTEEGGKSGIVALLVKQGFGVRDAFVQHKLSKAEARGLVGHMTDGANCAKTTLDHVRQVCSHAIAVNLEIGTLPPFGLLDCAESLGLTELVAERCTVETLVAQLVAAVEPSRLTTDAVAATLQQSAAWPEDHPVLHSWLVDDATLTRMLGRRRASRDKQLGVILAGPMQASRRNWAEIAAWTALSLKHRSPPAEWQGFAIVARELLGTRPLEEIGLMRTIANASLTALEFESMLGGLFAA